MKPKNSATGFIAKQENIKLLNRIGVIIINNSMQKFKIDS